MLSAADLDRRG